MQIIFALYYSNSFLQSNHSTIKSQLIISICSILRHAYRPLFSHKIHKLYDLPYTAYRKVYGQQIIQSGILKKKKSKVWIWTYSMFCFNLLDIKVKIYVNKSVADENVRCSVGLWIFTNVNAYLLVFSLNSDDSTNNLFLQGC